jgi:putative endonuclease
VSEYIVYILKSESTGRFYTGYTSDLSKRLAKHKAGATKTTRGMGPWKLVYQEAFETKKDATARERELKRLKGRGIYLNL